MKKGIFFFLVCLAFKNLFATDEIFIRSFHYGFKSVYNFEFTKADSVFFLLKKDYPEEINTWVLGSNYYWWKIRSGDDNSFNRKKYFTCLDEVEKILNKKKSAKQITQEDIFHYINLYSYRARMELFDNNYLKVFSYMNKCNAFILLSAGKEDTYEPFNLTSGLYNCFMAMAKKNHPFFAPYFLLAPSCDLQTGLKQLNKCSSASDFLLQTEANYFLMILYGEGDVDYVLSASYAEKLLSAYPDNLLYQYYLFKVKLLSGNLESAMKNLILLYQKSKSGNSLTDAQRKYFTDLAGKDMSEYYKKHPIEKPEIK